MKFKRRQGATVCTLNSRESCIWFYGLGVHEGNALRVQVREEIIRCRETVTVVDDTGRVIERYDGANRRLLG